MSTGTYVLARGPGGLSIQYFANTHLGDSLMHWKLAPLCRQKDKEDCSRPRVNTMN